MDVRRNLRIIMKNHGADPEIGFFTKGVRVKKETSFR